VVQLVELPVVFVIHEDQELLMSESWVEPLLARLQQQQQDGSSSSEGMQQDGVDASSSSSSTSAAAADHTVITLLDNAAGLAAADVDIKPPHSSGNSRWDQLSKPAAAAAAAAKRAAAAASGSETAAAGSSSSSSPNRSPSPNSSSSSHRRVVSMSSFASSSSKHADADSSSSPGFNSHPLNLEPCSSLLLPDGPTPMGSTADCISAQSVAAAAAAAAAGGGTSSSSSSRAGKGYRNCPMLIFLSQNDPCDSVAAALKNVEGLVAADLAGLPLGNKVGGVLCSSLGWASCISSNGLIFRHVRAVIMALMW
jgi:hypothetical protein